MPITSKLSEITIPHRSFHDVFFESIEKYGNSTALINHDTKQTMTYAEIKEKAEYVAKGLLFLGLQKGEVVILCVPNCPEFVYLFMGISMAGGIVSPLHPDFRVDEMRLQVNNSMARFAFTVPSAIDTLSIVFSEMDEDHRVVCIGEREEAHGYLILSDLSRCTASDPPGYPEICSEEDLVFLPYSSGTFGPRKGVAITHYTYNAMIGVFNNVNEYIVPARGENIIARISFHGSLGRDVLFSALFNGATVITSLDTRPVALAEHIQLYSVRSLFVTPRMLIKLCEAVQSNHLHLSSLINIITGNASMDEAKMRMALSTLPNVQHFDHVYEMTEVGTICRTPRSSEYIPQSCGMLCSGISLNVIDVISGNELGPDEKGLILIRGENVFSPYWCNDEATMEDFKYNGWRNTGDIGYYDTDGNVYLVDRMKHVVKVNGLQVSPNELEKILESHPNVAEAAVVPIAVANDDERPVAFVVLKPKCQASEEEIMNFVNTRVAVYKQVLRVVIALHIPRSPSGRILRRLLRESANSLENDI